MDFDAIICGRMCGVRCSGIKSRAKYQIALLYQLNTLHRAYTPWNAQLCINFPLGGGSNHPTSRVMRRLFQKQILDMQLLCWFLVFSRAVLSVHVLLIFSTSVLFLSRVRHLNKNFEIARSVTGVSTRDSRMVSAKCLGRPPLGQSYRHAYRELESTKNQPNCPNQTVGSHGRSMPWSP